MSDRTYKIGDLAGMFGLTVRTLRYYEELGLLKAADREEGVHRRYPENNIVYLKRIEQLKSYGLTLGEIKEFFELAEEDRSGASCRNRLIEKYRERITELEAERTEISSRIDEIRWHIDQLASVGNFFECPGSQCPGCPYGGTCELRSLGDRDAPGGPAL
jgi:DNA-binding transcriptional MerR regulator